MLRDYKVYLEDILEAIRKARNYTEDLSHEKFPQGGKTKDAVVRNLEVIGEAARKISEDIRSAHPEVEWRKIIGLRDIMIHEYFPVDFEVIWDVLQNKLPILESQMERILSES